MKGAGPRSVARVGRLGGLRPSAAALALVFAAAGAAADMRPAAGQSEAASAEAVADSVPTGDTVLLRDGRVVRLAGIIAPRATDSGPRRAVESAAEESRAALAAFVRGRPLRLRGALVADRHKRIAADVEAAELGDLAAAMLRAGQARVFIAVAPSRLASLLAAEKEARTARRGLWERAAYAVRADAEAGGYTRSFQLVEGRVLAVGRARGMVYLNFGADYRRDFTIGLDRAALRAFRGQGVEPRTFAGKRVRVRGWLAWRNGPYIAAADPGAIEVLE